MGEWQPIETYPNNGADVLVYEDGVITVASRDMCECDKQPHVGRCPQYPYHWWELAADGWYSEGMQGTLNPTHWMPLPEPPTT